MEFKQSLSVTAAAVEARLDALTQAERAAGAPARLCDAMRHGLLGGGKRVRPFLVIESARLFGVTAESALDTAAAIECIHCYSLAHDDLPAMDNDAMRRGRPTVWKAFDDWTAILAGDALLTLAFDILGRPSTHGDARIRAELVLVLAAASGARGMVGGQALDLEAERLAGAAAADLDHIRKLQAMKTGALIRAACEAGAVLGGAAPEPRQALVRYGRALGLAFQIADDLLDAEGDATTVGKAVGKDAEAGKATFVSLIGIAAAREKLAAVEEEAIAALEIFGDHATPLVDAARFVARRTS